MVFAGGCEQSPHAAEDDQWRTLSIGAGVTFEVPSAVREIEGEAIDSLAGELADDRIEISYDYGWYSSPLAGLEKVAITSREGELDGRPARFMRTESVSAVHVPLVEGQMRFTLVVSYRAPAHLALAERIIGSVRFGRSAAPAN